MASGTVKFFDTDKGFGFIKPDDGGNDVFIHVSELQRSGIKFVMEGDRLSYEMGPGKNGRMAASQVSTLAR
jgi:CspA family cold shock protein